jgi:hypothetical protein
MKAIIYISISFFLFPSPYVQAQNFVPNPSFEEYTQIPNYTNNGMIEYAPPWFRTPVPYYIYGGSYTGTPDFLHEYMPDDVFGTPIIFPELPTGYGFMRISTARKPLNGEFLWCESTEVKLETNLLPGIEYKFELQLKLEGLFALEGGSVQGSNEFGVYFYKDTIFNKGNTDYQEQGSFMLDAFVDISDSGNPFWNYNGFAVEPHFELDTLLTDVDNWYMYESTITPEDTLSFMVFGQFNSNLDILWGGEVIGEYTTSIASTFVVDDVSIYKVGEVRYIADAGPDSTICLGDSIQIGTHDYEDYWYWWTPNEGMPISWADKNPGMPWVSPTENTTYQLYQKDFSFVVSTDAVTITVDDCEKDISEYLASKIKIYPNPASSTVNIESGYTIGSWKLMDAVGKKVASSKYLVSSTNLNVDVSSFDAGLYFFEMEIEGQKIIKQLVIE